jgi:hypothetical protein
MLRARLAKTTADHLAALQETGERYRRFTSHGYERFGPEFAGLSDSGSVTVDSDAYYWALRVVEAAVAWGNAWALDDKGHAIIELHKALRPPRHNPH